MSLLYGCKDLVRKRILSNSQVVKYINYLSLRTKMNISEKKHMQWLLALKKMGHKEYWNRANTVEFFAFVIKAMIIIPGLLFGYQVWWFYIFAVVSSLGLIWSSTVKTIPTLIWFNILWSILGTIAILKYWIG